MLSGCYDRVPIEDLAVVFGFGYDIETNGIPKQISVIEFISIKTKEEPGTDYNVGKGNTIYDSIEDYKAKQSRRFGYGSELVYLISEDRARLGIEDVVQDLFRHFEVNTNAKVVICKGKCEDYFATASKTESASEKLSQLINFASDEYFFSSKNTVNDLMLMSYQQGREIYLPYIELYEDSPKLSGVAIFKEFKMHEYIPIEETKLLNIMRTSGGNGVVTILTNKTTDYLELTGTNKTKVKANLVEGILNYEINIEVTGDLNIDTIFEEELKKEQIKKIEDILSKHLQKETQTMADKVKNLYKYDCLDLTQYAIAKYGRSSGIDSNEIFLKSNIKVNSKVKIESIGRIYGATKKQ